MKKNYKNLFSIFALLSSSIAFGQHFTEDFENGGAVPTGWTLTNGTDDWQFDDGTTHGPGSTHGGSYAAYFDDYNYTSGTTADMVTPVIDLSSAINPELHFWYYDNSGSDVLEVLTSTDGTTFTSVFTSLTTVSSWTEIVVPIYALGGQSTVSIAFRGTSVYGVSNPYVDDVSVVDGPSCPAPSNVTATNVTSTGADIAWTTGGASHWNIEYGAAGYTQGTGTATNDVANPYTLSGLSANTDYDVYVQDSCGMGDVSTWTMVSFTTSPNMHAFPLTEDFEDSTLFFENNVASNTAWVLTDALVHAGTYSVFNGYGSSEDNILHETGVLDLSSAGAPVLEFWHIAKTEGGYDDCFVEISTDGGQSYTAIPSSAYRGSGAYSGLFSEDTYAAWGTTSSTVLDNSMWRKETFDLSAYNVANVRVRFRLNSDFTAQREGWYIDDLSIYEPTCPLPYGLTNAYQNEDSVVISWTAGYQETMWNVEYGTIGFTQGSGTMQTGLTTTTDTVTGLTLGSVYQFYVQADCGSGDASAWVGPITIATPIQNDSACQAISIPVDGSTNVFSNIGATIETGESALNGLQYNTVWFTAVVPASGHMIIATCGSEHNTAVGAYYNDTITCNDYSTFGELAYASSYTSSSSALCGSYGNGSVYICGATPGSTVLFYVGSTSSSSSNEGIINVIAIDASLAGYAGQGAATPVTACAGDTVNLWSSLTGQMTNNGTWTYPSNTSAIVDDSLVNTGAFSLVGNEVYYIVANTCDADTATVVINAQTVTNTGTAVSNYTECNAGDVYLFNGLTGTIDAGGTWSDDTQTNLLVGSKFIAAGLPVGAYQFTYTVNGGVCPPASTQVTVNLVDCTNIAEEGEANYVIYPNPNNGTFFIANGDNAGSIAMEVVDVQGKIVYSKSFNLAAGAQQEISLGNVETGVYLVRIVTNNKVINNTVIVK